VAGTAEVRRWSACARCRDLNRRERCSRDPGWVELEMQGDGPRAIDVCLFGPWFAMVELHPAMDEAIAEIVIIVAVTGHGEEEGATRRRSRRSSRRARPEASADGSNHPQRLGPCPAWGG
jgi:hypothetical protein